jgi:hypothetical protein
VENVDVTLSLSSASIDQARWITPRLGASPYVGSLVPTGFDSYVRLFYPVEIPWPGSGTTTWAKITEQLGHRFNADTGWQEIEEDAGYSDALGEPVSGTIPLEFLAGLRKVLKDAAGPEAVFFAMMWFGYADAPQDESNTFFIGPELEMRVLTGDLLPTPSDEFDRVPVNWWPDNHAWYLGGDLYGRSLYVGGSAETTSQLLTQFEGVRVELGTRVPFEP